MADVFDDSKKVISKKDSGFPAYLDFDTLRREGIEYLGNLAGKIWTDHNVHDPGITILEVLCYALLDIGYRTNLPVEDIFARDPLDTSSDDNFLPPSKILTCNPLTITDFRKLLVDIEGVRNAWLEVATDFDPEKFCHPDQQPPRSTPTESQTPARGSREVQTNRTFDGPSGALPSTPPKECCIEYLNGLYHVYLELEKNKEEEVLEKANKEAFLKTVKQALSSHRNFCEDFIDIKFLCKWEIGVCAEIELQPDADPEEVYLTMMEKLRDFFSPSPRFYTLSQLVDRKKTIDEIYAGRPYNIGASHGFVDTEEFEKLELRKSIHVSDVYSVLFSIPGIRKVQRLRMRNCDSNKSLQPDKWVIQIKECHVPDFSPACSEFRFLRQGLPVSFDPKKFDAIVAIDFDQNGKVIVTGGAGKLDPKLPDAYYRTGLGKWQSIQIDFPRVYGIAEGGLPEEASPKRKSQALQLKGYLLFFDQLLADYVSQLKNIRSLFSLSMSKTNGAGHTYFINDIETVPGLQQLLRFPANASSIPPTGIETGVLAFPAARAEIEDLVKNGQIGKLDTEKINRKVFTTEAERNIAVNQFQEDAYNGLLDFYYVARDDGSIFYYAFGTSEDCAMIGTRFYTDGQLAKNATTALLFTASVPSNYKTYFAATQKKYSFNIEQKLSTYPEYLQLLIEDEATFLERRDSFLNHLLARFAERFTDYALVSYEQLATEEIRRNDIKTKEFFLSNYTELSSNRGLALNYLDAVWNSENISGFEKKCKTLMGTSNLGRQSLCNFFVYEYEDAKFVFTMDLGDEIFFKSDEKFESKEEAWEALQKLIGSLGERDSYHVQRSEFDKDFFIYVSYGGKKEAVFAAKYADRDTAEEVATRLQRTFSSDGVDGRTFVSSYTYAALLEDADENVVRIYQQRPNREGDAWTQALNTIDQINDEQVWMQASMVRPIDHLYFDPALHGGNKFIDLGRFSIDINKNVVGKPGYITYQVLDKDQHQFRFDSENEFASEEEAWNDCCHLLLLLTYPDHYDIRHNQGDGRWYLFIVDGEKRIARCTSSIFTTWEMADQVTAEIRKIVRAYEYHVRIDPVPDTWQFYHFLGFAPGRIFTVRSATDYRDEQAAVEALQYFSQNVVIAQAFPKEREWEIVSPARDGIRAILVDPLPGNENEFEETGTQLTGILDTIKAIRHSFTPEGLRTAGTVRPDEQSICPYTYQLVDKDNVYAVYGQAFSNKDDAKKLRKKIKRTNAADYNFLELNVHADITVERAGKDGRGRFFYYQFKSTNPVRITHSGVPKKLVLFESVGGYGSKEEAEAAFLQIYLDILSYGLDEANYGDNKIISETELRIEPDERVRTNSLVFIPKETLEILGSYPWQAIKELVKIVKSYPVRSIRKKKNCVTFNKLFLPCEEPCQPSEEDCGLKGEIPVYYFILYNKINDHEDWHSVKYFATIEETMQAFLFFTLLLQYEGNYFVDCDCTQVFKIFVREVLVESVDRFESEAAAWGKKGIQKFIGISQTKYSFNAFEDEDCCHRFFVACRNISAVHPCKYDTTELRNEMLVKLYRASKNLDVLPSYNFCELWNKDFPDLGGNVIATVQDSASLDHPTVFLEQYLRIISRILKCGLLIENDRVWLAENQRLVYFEPVPGSGIETPAQLMEKLLWVACYFPIVLQEDDGAVKYCIEIRLPGFSSCEDCGSRMDIHEKKEGRTGTDELCPVAWTSECCYNTCGDVVMAYDTIVSWVKEIRFYHKVFDCHCGPYGIALHSDQSFCVSTDANEQEAHDTGSYLYHPPFLSRVTAINPQCYTNPEMACDAIKRAKNLVNREGLHLAEHILLRPHCEEDCDCLIKTCDDGINEFDKCDFPPWKDNDEDDVCDTRDAICFKPGHDPYSFIATVALPAWPERFRKKDNRKIVETLLQKEAPAHVLLRILWLAPHDLCCFESHLKRWLTWMAYQKSCDGRDPSCEFVQFLFNHQFECWDDPEGCQDCGGDTPTVISCVDLAKKEESRLIKTSPCTPVWFDQVSELFCWKNDCDDYRFEKCIDESDDKDEGAQHQILHEEATAEMQREPLTHAQIAEMFRFDREELNAGEAPTDVETEWPTEEDQEQRPEVIPYMPDQHDQGEAPAGGAEDLQTNQRESPGMSKAATAAEKRNFVNARFTSYKDEATKLIKETNENRLAIRTLRFVSAAQPVAEVYNKLMSALLDTLKEKGTLSRKQVLRLVRAATFFVWDKNSFNGKKVKQLVPFKTGFDALKRGGLKTGKIYQDWLPEEVKRFEPRTDIEAINELII